MAFTDSMTGVATWPTATIESPHNADPNNNANWKALLQKIANGLVYLRSNQLIVDVLPGVISPYTSVHWTVGSGSPGAETLVQDDVASAWNAKILLPRPPPGTTLSSVAVKLKGAGGHAALPGTVPSAEVQIRDLSTLDGAWSSLTGYTNDPAADKTAYELLHDLTISAAHAVVSTYTYCLVLLGETGANSVVGLTYYGCRITYTST